MLFVQLDFLYCIVLLALPFIVWSLFAKRKRNAYSFYEDRDWLYAIKYILAYKFLRASQDSSKKELLRRRNHNLLFEDRHVPSATWEHEAQIITAIDKKGNSFSMKMTRFANNYAQLRLCLRLENGSVFTLPDNENVSLHSIHPDRWYMKGLRFQVLEPYKRTRITFNGMLKDLTKPEDSDLEFIKFNFIMNTIGTDMYYPEDAYTRLLSSAIAKEKWKDNSWIDKVGGEKYCQQFGMLQGTLKLNENESLILRLSGIRKYSWGTSIEYNCHKEVNIFIEADDGMLFDVTIQSLKNGCWKLIHGFVLTQSGAAFPIENLDVRSKLLHSIIPDVLMVHITAKGHVYKCVLHLEKESSAKMTSEMKHGYKVTDMKAQCSINTIQGRGYVQFWHSKKGQGVNFPPPLLLAEGVNNKEPWITARLSDEGARNVLVSGGKGCSLSLLSSIKTKKFTVPDGYIITMLAFRVQMDFYRTIKEAIFDLGKSIHIDDEKTFAEKCQRTVDIISETDICPEVLECIEAVLGEEISIYYHKSGYAVRSSGADEDCEDLSAAGQNKTFLSCKRLDDILKAIRLCWASQFSYESVRYRRQHCLPVLSDIAVVVQKMVAADSAGVLFTCHPTTENPSHMVIASNFGLGESVVSGQADPDLITLKKETNGTQTILSKKLGKKNCKIEIDEDDHVKSVNDENTEVFSISDEQALQLGEVGVMLEDLFGSPRDVEWAFYKGKLYLLQSRPITTLNGWSDFELFHEFDVPILSENVIHTMANAGEVCPGALTLLSQSTTRYTASVALSLHTGGVHKESMPTIQHHAMIDVINSIHRNPRLSIDMNARIIDLAVFGHPVIDDRIHSIALRQHGVLTPWKQTKETLRMYRFARRNEKILKDVLALSNSMKIDISGGDSLKDIYARIDNFIKDLTVLSKLHCTVSGTSVFYQLVAMNVLAEDKTELCQEHHNDISLLLSSCNDISSAEIPHTLDEIVRILKEDGLSETFATIDPKHGMKYLKTSCPTVFSIVQEFLDKHGHRLLREFELQKDTWKMDPSQLIRMLQANCRTKTKPKREYEDVNTIISKIRSPKRTITRYILKIVMSRARTAVGIREKSKSELVRSFNKLRIAYRELGELMCKKGILPQKSLIFHLSHNEVGQLIHRHNIPELISKATRRQKLYPEWDKQRYPEIMFGIPRPLESPNVKAERTESEVVCKGTPVYLGEVCARACVITRVEDANHLQAGDILITYSTDIGWSPYFPSLSGLVTELGGLISHGAVIAREYGLPCIVGAQNCTSLFRTGDTVLLSADKGLLELTEKKADQETNMPR